MTSTEVLDVLRSKAALLEGHFEVAPGVHADVVMRPLKATQFAPFNRRLCYEIVRHFLELDIHVVIAPTISAIPAAVEVGRQLEARVVFTAPVAALDPTPDAPAGGTSLHEGFELHEGERALIMMSLLESDEEIDAVAALLRAANARLVGVGSIIDARRARRRFTVKDVSAVQIVSNHYPAAGCPLCAAGIPVAGV